MNTRNKNKKSSLKIGEGYSSALVIFKETGTPEDKPKSGKFLDRSSCIRPGECLSISLANQNVGMVHRVSQRIVERKTVTNTVTTERFIETNSSTFYLKNENSI